MRALVAAVVVVAHAGCGRVSYDPGQLAVDCTDAPTGHCYSLVLTRASWSAARGICTETLGATAHLVTVGGPNENAAVLPFARTIPFLPSDTNPNQRQRMWMAGNDLDSIGTWEWTTGEPFDFVNWRTGEPGSPGSESCLIMLGEYAGQWDDRPCDAEYEFLCERE